MLFAGLDSAPAFQQISLIQRAGRKVNLASWISSYLFVDPRDINEVLGPSAQSLIANSYNLVIHGPVFPSALKAMTSTSIIESDDQWMVSQMTSKEAYIRTPKTRTVGLCNLADTDAPALTKEEVERKFAAYYLDLRDEMLSEGAGASVDKQTEWDNFVGQLIADGRVPGEAITWKCPRKLVA